MPTVIRTQTIELKEEVINLLKFVKKANKEALTSLKDNNLILATKTLDYTGEAYEMYQDITDEVMFALTKNPLAKELRRIMSYQSISRLLARIVRDTIKISKFTIIFNNSIGESTTKRMNRMNKIFVDMLNILEDEISKQSRNRKEIREIAATYKKSKTMINKIREELAESLSKHQEINEVKERMFTITICEAIHRNTEKLTHIFEDLLFITDGKHHSLI